MDNENKKIIKQKSDLWTVPNILTYLRFALVVPFVILFLNEKYLESAICIGLSGISDCLDGFFARKLNQVTQLGKLLDPIADKITLISVMFCMAFYAPNVIPILVVLIAKDVAMLMDLFNHSSPAITLRYIGIRQDQRDKAMSNFDL